MTFREILTEINARLEAAIQTKDPVKIAVAVMSLMPAMEADDDTADDLLEQTNDLMDQALALGLDIDFIKPRQ